MTIRATSESVGIDTAIEGAIEFPEKSGRKGVLDEFRTRNVKVLFGVLFAFAFGTTVLGLVQEPFTGDLAYDAGFIVGYLVVAGLIDIVVVSVITVVVKSVYLGIDRLYTLIR